VIAFIRRWFCRRRLPVLRIDGERVCAR
jgi:hypothetical protein